MTLMALGKNNPVVFESYNVQQIVAICGDGHLLDKSACSSELRDFLTYQSSRRLTSMAQYCLDQSFPKSGAVLQDIINEIGRRLGYEVENGRYSGSQKEIGYDGLWSETESQLIVEVKTTDAYRINLDVLAGYASRLKNTNNFAVEPNILLAVGRQDTGDLEAQIRGSRHAWQVRLVSIESLNRLMLVREEIDDKYFVDKLRKILTPLEYTRVDKIIDIVFETKKETEDKLIEVDLDGDAQSEENISRNSGWSFTPANQIEAKRDALLKQFFSGLDKSYRRVSRAQYIGESGTTRIACSISKRYDRDYQPYWYAFHPRWLEFLTAGANSFFILGCMDKSEGFALPLLFLDTILDKLHKTGEVPKHYWHVALGEDDEGVFINLSKTGERVYLRDFSFACTA